MVQFRFPPHSLYSWYVPPSVRLHVAPKRPIAESSRLQSGAELKAETCSRTLSAPGSDALAVFAYSITDEVNRFVRLEEALRRMISV